MHQFLRSQIKIERTAGRSLYLDLAAKELMHIRVTSHIEIIERLSNNPDNLFSLSMTRLKRQPTVWREVIKPILGLLLAAQEPLSVPHIRQIFESRRRSHQRRDYSSRRAHSE